jgi:AbrB family looped-hinge helix DNA binding protein
LAIDMTKLSQKGQVVIPSTVRSKLGLRRGTRFLVVGIGNTVVLRRLDLSEETISLKKILEESRKKARKVGFSSKEINEFIRRTRKVS